jgi:hypothetical protein
LRPPQREAALITRSAYSVRPSATGTTASSTPWPFRWTGKLSWQAAIRDTSGRNRSACTCLRRVPGLPDLVYHLYLSPDGRFIAGARRNERYSHFLGCGLAGSCADADYADLSTAIAFDRSGRLAAVAHDGFIRLYDKEFQRIAKVETPGGMHSSMVAFSPDATRLVVGYETAPPSTC